MKQFEIYVDDSIKYKELRLIELNIITRAIKILDRKVIDYNTDDYLLLGLLEKSISVPRAYHDTRTARY